MQHSEHDHDGGALKARRAGIDTYQEAVIYMNRDCPVCRAEGFNAQLRVEVGLGERRVIATLNVVSGELVRDGDAGLSESARRSTRTAARPAYASSERGTRQRVRQGERVEKGAPLYTVHAEGRGELEYALNFAARREDIVYLEER